MHGGSRERARTHGAAGRGAGTSTGSAGSRY